MRFFEFSLSISNHNAQWLCWLWHLKFPIWYCIHALSPISQCLALSMSLIVSHLPELSLLFFDLQSWFSDHQLKFINVAWTLAFCFLWRSQFFRLRFLVNWLSHYRIRLNSRSLGVVTLRGKGDWQIYLPKLARFLIEVEAIFERDSGIQQ